MRNSFEYLDADYSDVDSRIVSCNIMSVIEPKKWLSVTSDFSKRIYKIINHLDT